MAFRITLQSSSDDTTVVRLEGRLAAEDLSVLEACLAEIRDEPFALDLAELRWLAPMAIDRLAGILRGGARVVASSPFVDRLLAREDPDSRPAHGAATHAKESLGTRAHEP